MDPVLVTVRNSTAYWHFIDGDELGEYYKYVEKNRCYLLLLVQQYYYNIKQKYQQICYFLKWKGFLNFTCCQGVIIGIFVKDYRKLCIGVRELFLSRIIGNCFVPESVPELFCRELLETVYVTEWVPALFLSRITGNCLCNGVSTGTCSVKDYRKLCTGIPEFFCQALPEIINATEQVPTFFLSRITGNCLCTGTFLSRITGNC